MRAGGSVPDPSSGLSNLVGFRFLTRKRASLLSSNPRFARAPTRSCPEGAIGSVAEVEMAGGATTSPGSRSSGVVGRATPQAGTSWDKITILSHVESNVTRSESCPTKLCLPRLGGHLVPRYRLEQPHQMTVAGLSRILRHLWARDHAPASGATRVCPLTKHRPGPYDSMSSRLKDSEIPDAFLAGDPSTDSSPRPYRPGEDGVLGFVRSVPPADSEAPRPASTGGSRGFFVSRPLDQRGCTLQAG